MSVYIFNLTCHFRRSPLKLRLRFHSEFQRDVAVFSVNPVKSCKVPNMFVTHTISHNALKNSILSYKTLFFDYCSLVTTKTIFLCTLKFPCALVNPNFSAQFSICYEPCVECMAPVSVSTTFEMYSANGDLCNIFSIKAFEFCL